MHRRRFKTFAACLPFLAALVLGAWLSAGVLSAWPRRGHAGGTSPKVVLPCKQRDFGTVTQGRILRTTFPVQNTGTRRLIVVEDAERRCGRSADPRSVMVAPGDSTELAVEVDTATWCGRMEHVAHYSTNDPSLPRFALRMTAVVTSPPSP